MGTAQNQILDSFDKSGNAVFLAANPTLNGLRKPRNQEGLEKKTAHLIVNRSGCGGPTGHRVSNCVKFKSGCLVTTIGRIKECQKKRNSAQRYFSRNERTRRHRKRTPTQASLLLHSQLPARSTRTTIIIPSLPLQEGTEKKLFLSNFVVRLSLPLTALHLRLRLWT